MGIGASAGGLEAFRQIFNQMPVDTGMAFVLIQHLDPTHPSLSVDIISKSSQLKVEEVTDGTQVKPNHIYVIPPNKCMEIQERVLKLSPRADGPGQNMVIDVFFQSLARSEKNKAVGVVLSGTATDGTIGLKTIKAEGGVTYAQDPDSAKCPGMPRSAIDAGVVDFILKPENIADKLAKISAHPYMTSDTTTSDDPQERVTLNKLFSLLRAFKKVDFSGYKQTTIMRRVQRRMLVQRAESLQDYVSYLEKNDEEVHALYKDLLINVTDFFRDPESFETLAKTVLPNILKNKSESSIIRVWVPGCSTGEEVYSLAISLLESLSQKEKQHYEIQIFATDISDDAIQTARAGKYSESIMGGLSKERLQRFFHKVEEGGYQINKGVRDLCLFSRHDVSSDPPFAKLDLISCRNVMIYFGKAMQNQVIPIFHYALLKTGYLWLGRSENIGESSKLFSMVNKAHKIYSKSNVPTPALHFAPKPGRGLSWKTVEDFSSAFTGTRNEIQKDVDKIIMSKFSPPGVVVNSDLEILQFRGRTTPYLEPASGQPSLNLLKMIRPELLASLRQTIQLAKQENKSLERLGLHFESDEKPQTVDFEVIPVNPKATLAKDKTFLILFKKPADVTKIKSNSTTKNNTAKDSDKKPIDQNQHIIELRKELLEMKDYQQSLIEQYEITQEELTVANEELQSTNEEFQSTNEEIETAKEELQSTNEELTTVNEELRVRNTDLTVLSDDLNNLLVSIEIPVLIVDGSYRVRRFSPKAKTAFNLIPSDVGRPISDIRPNFDLSLSRVILEVSESLSPKQIEVQDFSGNWLRLMVRPYKTTENKIDGAILSLTDIDDIKKKEKKSTDAFLQAEQSNHAKDVFLATLSHELRTPLSSILTWAQLIARGKVDYEKAKLGASVIEQNAKAQNQLIDDLLDISRIIVGKLSVDIETIEPAVVIKRAIESVQPMANKKSIKLKLCTPSSTELIRADPTRLQQIIWNLLTNAIKFSPEKSTINIDLKYVDENNKRFAQVKVTDAGQGIPNEFLSNIFKRFSQADGTSTRVHGGLGLGLSIVQSLVDLHNGSVKAENGGDDRGAVFTLNFPVICQQTAITKKEVIEKENSNKVESNVESPKLDSQRVLIVDDDESSLEAMSIYLKSFGAQVMAVNSARKALEEIKTFRPSILLSDLSMPEEDGFSLIRKVRSLDEDSGGQVPALALSAHKSKESTRHALASGFQDLILKPVEANALGWLILKMVNEL